MNRARTLRRRACACALSFILAATLFPAAAFAEGEKSFGEKWNEQSRISVTAPVAIIFGSDGNGFDVQSTENPEAIAAFKNTGSTQVVIDKIQYLPIQPDATMPNAFKGNVEDAVKSVEMHREDSISSAEVIEASKTDPTEIKTQPMIPKNSTTKFDLKLNLNKSNFKQDAPDGGATAYPIGKLKYIFDSTDFWVKDLRNADNPVYYSAGEVKQHAKAIAENSDANIKSMYQTFLSDESKYECIAMWRANLDYSEYSTPYKVRIIGLNHDTLTNPEGEYGKGTSATKAGITFQFVNCLMLYDLGKMTYYRWDETGYSFAQYDRTNGGNLGGWGRAMLRARMLEGDQSDEVDSDPSLTIRSAQDDNAIWDLLPKGKTKLSNALALVQKKYMPLWYTSIEECPDKLFVLSWSELAGVAASPHGDEGTQYEYWRVHSTAAERKMGRVISADGTVAGPETNKTRVLWLRSIHPYETDFYGRYGFCYVEDGVPVKRLLTQNGRTNFSGLYSLGVAPAFCL